MKNFTAEKIATIQSTIATIGTLVQNGCTEEVYNQNRVKLNQLLIETLAGCEIGSNKKGETTVNFNKPIPNKMQVAEIALLIDGFVGAIENPFLMKLAGADKDNMEIPVRVPGGVDKIEKPNNKAVKAAAINGADAWYRKALDGKDCYMIAAIGEQARKDANTKKILIIGGVVVVVAAAGAVGCYFYNKKKEEEAVAEVQVETQATDDVPVVEVPVEDIPVEESTINDDEPVMQ